MQTPTTRQKVHRRIRYRIRAKISGTSTRPRLAVFRSLKHIYAQAIDDESGRTLAHASSLDKEIKSKMDCGSNTKAATEVGAAIGKKLKDAGIQAVILDRGGWLYRGRVKALAEAARSAGLKF